MMKDKAINILTAELSALPVLIMTYYALTAKPTGQWQLTFNLPVYWLISSYLLALPLAPHPGSPLAPHPPQNEFTCSKGELKVRLSAQ